MKYTYLLIDLLSVVVPFAFSFHPRIRFERQWAAHWPATLIAAFVFVVWDMIYTQWGVWGFNPTYLTGIYVYNLPLEEILFFICIPYSCVFTYYCLGLQKQIRRPWKFEKTFTAALAAILLIAGLIWADKKYTVATSIPLALFFIWLQFDRKVSWMKQFYQAYTILLLPFFIVNGMLTGTGLEKPVVWYNNVENIGVRLLTIPLEDVFYGMFLILLNIALFEYFRTRQKTGA
jgi:lycopene cyclase domain-containing protein